MSATRPMPLSELYEADEVAWLEAMARIAGRRSDPEMDLPHLAEYLTDMAKRDRREVESRLRVLIAHLLKWQHQPGRRSRSWRVTVLDQREELLAALESGTLRAHAEESLDKVYAAAARRAAAETGLPESAFLAECPYTLDEILTAAVAGETVD